jgi:glycosyltransferase involved in cell wall biosynthesis
MNIAVYLPLNTQKRFSAKEQLVLELVKSIIHKKSEHRFIILSSNKTNLLFPNSNNVETVFFKTGLIKKIWWKGSLPRLLKKINADIFFCADPEVSLTASIKLVYLITGKKKIKPVVFKNISSLIVMNRILENAVAASGIISKEKVKVLPPSPLIDAMSGSNEENILTKEKYSNGKEYFFYSIASVSNEDFIILLKAFSHFKKRLQSGFKLLINVTPNSFFDKSIDNYKYRHDVVFVANEDNSSLAKICAAAYAVLLPFETDDDTVAVMNAIHSGVPVITANDSVITDIAGDAVLTAEKNNSKDIGEKMIRLYTDEDFRSRLIENGKTVSGYDHRFAADQLWQFIMDALQ